MGTLNRSQLFQIEKEYWRIVEAGNCKFADIPHLIAERVGFASPEQVARWLDQLHDETKVAKLPPASSVEEANSIIEHYHKYLEQAEPPEESLHWTVARKLDVRPGLVHRVLCEYRCSRKPE